MITRLFAAVFAPLFTGALLLVFSFTVASAQSEPPLPAPLQKQRDTGAQIYYLGKHDTLDGWVMVRAGQPEFYYATPDNKALVLGLLFDGDGTLLTATQMTALQESRKQDLLEMVKPTPTPGLEPAPVAPVAEAAPVQQTPQIIAAPQAPAPATETAPATQPAAAPVQPVNPPATPPASPAVNPSSRSEQLLAQMQDAPGITWGSPAAPTFYGFIDPNCTHCQRFLREVAPFVNAGRVAVRIVPVGFSDASLKQAAFVLAASNGADLMLRYASGDTAAIPVTEISTDALMGNVRLMQDYSLMGTPIILYRGPDGTIRLVRGRPLDVAATVNDLTGTAR